LASLTIDRMSKDYGDVRAVDALDIRVEDGAFLTLLGPSGCGKSTALSCIAGLEALSQGRILFGEQDVSDLEPHERNVAMVFQDYALYPHMNVAENIAFGLKQQRIDGPTIKRQVDAAAEMLGLGELLHRRPAELSGGQRQRVAVGRAAVRNPAVLLMDEPLSNLDAGLRLKTRTEIKRLQRELGVTTVFVTHDQEEAMVLSDQMAVMRDGVLQQMGPPMAVYREPANLFVASFIGSPAMNFLDAELGLEDSQLAGRFAGESFTLPLEVVAERSLDRLRSRPAGAHGYSAERSRARWRRAGDLGPCLPGRARGAGDLSRRRRGRAGDQGRLRSRHGTARRRDGDAGLCEQPAQVVRPGDGGAVVRDGMKR
jgi:ABC-type sugar transport system ATPase subunit